MATPLSIATQPTNKSVVVGQPAEFKVVATGGTAPYAFQWKVNGTDIPAATSDTLKITSVAAADNGKKYSVVVKDSGTPVETVTSTEVTLTVTAAAPTRPAPPAPTQGTSPWLVAALVAAALVLVAAMIILARRPAAAPVDVNATVQAALGATQTMVVESFTATPRPPTATKAATMAPLSQEDEFATAVANVPTLGSAQTATPDGQGTKIAELEAQLTAAANAPVPTATLAASTATTEAAAVTGDEPPAPPADFPYELKLVTSSDGTVHWALADFDPATWPADPECQLNGADPVAFVEEAGGPAEKCQTMLEWSLKNGDITLASGRYPMPPGEWLRLTYEQSHDRVRFVGTIWYLPKGAASHADSVENAAGWQLKNPTIWVVIGLSPVDHWVTALAAAAEKINP